jgi:transposase
MDNRRPRKGEKEMPHFQHLNPYAAGIDVGSRSHFVAVPEAADEKPVREFSCFTGDLHRLADWLHTCGIKTVAMESTGIYWIPVFEILECRGFEVKLVNAHHVKNVPGRKTDVSDCQWLQRLHSYGLLEGAFRPPDQVCVLRSYIRQRMNLVQYAAAHIQHMQKALGQMNLLLHNVVTDVTGVTGMRIIKAILAGERDPLVLASFRDPRCKNSVETIARSLEGHYKEEHLFGLKQAVELYEFYQAKIADCDRQIEEQLAAFDDRSDGTEAEAPPRSGKGKPRGNEPSFDVQADLYRMTGVDLTLIDGIDAYTALKVVSEVGTDMSHWKSPKQFASWLGLCPGNKVSGGKRLSGKTKTVANRAATALRMAANGLHRSKSALGAYLRRQKARLGAPKAITATAHKLARLIYSMLKHGTQYVDAGQDYYEQRYRTRVVENLKRRASEFGFVLVKTTLCTETRNQ